MQGVGDTSPHAFGVPCLLPVPHQEDVGVLVQRGGRGAGFTKGFRPRALRGAGLGGGAAGNSRASSPGWSTSYGYEPVPPVVLWLLWGGGSRLGGGC